jgi:hypothetical protein
MKTLIRLCEPSSQDLEIPKRLPPIVRDVAESLALRDHTSVKGYLQTYQQGNHG